MPQMQVVHIPIKKYVINQIYTEFELHKKNQIV